MTKRLNSSSLHALVIRSLEEANIDAVRLSTVGEKPLRIALNAEAFAEPLIFRLFVWNITHGGATRHEDEFRIQLTGATPDKHPGETTVVLGWSEAFEVFAGWSAEEHRDRSSVSPSLQVRKPTLLDAYDHGLAAAFRGGGDVVVAMRPALLPAYLLNAEALHNADPEEVLAEVAAVAPRAPSSPDPGPHLATAPVRAIHIRQIAARVREWDFSKRVMEAYAYGCAICGIELMVVEAAHIVPVAWPESDDSTRNGIALCAIHHKAYDKKLITINPDYTISVSSARLEHLRSLDRSAGEEELLSLDGTSLQRLPQKPGDYPDPEFLRLGQEVRSWV